MPAPAEAYRFDGSVTGGIPGSPPGLSAAATLPNIGDIKKANREAEAAATTAATGLKREFIANFGGMPSGYHPVLAHFQYNSYRKCCERMIANPRSCLAISSSWASSLP